MAECGKKGYEGENLITQFTNDDLRFTIDGSRITDEPIRPFIRLKYFIKMSRILVEKKVFVQRSGGGRSTSYDLLLHQEAKPA